MCESGNLEGLETGWQLGHLRAAGPRRAAVLFEDTVWIAGWREIGRCVRIYAYISGTPESGSPAPRQYSFRIGAVNPPRAPAA